MSKTELINTKENVKSVKKTKLNFTLTETQKNDFLKIGSGLAAGTGIGALAAAFSLGFATFPTKAIAKENIDLENKTNEDEVNEAINSIENPQIAIEEANYYDIAIYSDAPLASQVNDAMSFNVAFAAARAEVGAGGVFQWNNGIYNTYTAEEWAIMDATDKSQYWASVDNQAFDYNAPDPAYVVIQPADVNYIQSAPANNYPAHWGQGGGTVYHATMGASVEEVERFIPADNDVHVVSLDYNKDGIIDGIGVDSNHDGRVDVVTYDPNEIAEFPSEIGAGITKSTDVIFDSDTYEVPKLKPIEASEIEIEEGADAGEIDTDNLGLDNDAQASDFPEIIDGI